MVDRPAWRLSTVLLVALAGCGGSLGPRPMPTTRLEGRVVLDGKPVGPLWLEMLPADGTVGRLRTAPVRRDGTFAVDGVPVGRVAVRLAGRPFPPTGNPLLDRFLASSRRAALLRLDTQPGEIRPIELDLREQMLAFVRVYGTNF